MRRLTKTPAPTLTLTLSSHHFQAAAMVNVHRKVELTCILRFSPPASQLDDIQSLKSEFIYILYGSTRSLNWVSVVLQLDVTHLECDYL